MAESPAVHPIRHLLTWPLLGFGLVCSSAPCLAQTVWQPLNPNQGPEATPPPQAPQFVPLAEPSAAADPSTKGPIWLPVPDTATSPSAGPEWKAVAPHAPGDGIPIADQPTPTKPGTASVTRPSQGTASSTKPSTQFPNKAPRTQAEANALLGNLPITASDYLPLLRLGLAVPTANQLPEQNWQFSYGQVAPFGGGGQAGGTGNQNYYARFDAGITDRLQFSAFYSVADDPLYALIGGRGQPFNTSSQPANYMEAFGGALQWQFAAGKNWKLGLVGSLEQFNVGSGGCDSFSCRTNNSYSPNIFNNSGRRVFTRNLIGSIALPVSWQATRKLQFTVTPGASVLPPTQGAGKGGAGTFYGTNLTLAAGASWRLAPQLTLFGSGLVPLGPGTNSFDAKLSFSRVPILTAGLNYAINPRIALEAAVTNGWGATPATALLALPSDNKLGFTGRFIYNPGARDSPALEMSSRQRSLALGGLTVNIAQVPSDGTLELWANADSLGNLFGFVGYSLSNDFQLQYSGGVFNKIRPATALSNAYATDGGYNERWGGKGIVFNQLRGAPFSSGGRITVGRNLDPDSFQGYLFFETINTWEATRWLALNLNPKIAWSGVSSPWGVGLSANLQLGRSFQLIPELNLVGSQYSASNGTLALRWLASESGAIDLYVSNAAGLLDMGQLMGNKQLRVGGRLLLAF